MFQGKKLGTSVIFGAVLFVVFLFSAVGTICGQDNPKGKVAGNIYAQDGNTPLEGVVIKFKNVSTGKLYESRKSDTKGFFEVVGIERGIYHYGVLTSKGNFNAEGLVGLKLKANETAKMSIALKPYSNEAALTMEEFYNDLDVNGESYVGRVVEYDAAKKNAQVQVERGFIQQKDKIRTKGKETDFKQGVDQLESEGNKVKRVYAGQVASLKMKQSAKVDDMVFVLKKRQFLPLFAGAGGIAALLAANGLITWGIVSLDEDCVPCSPYVPKKK